jgi:hypothetical protein
MGFIDSAIMLFLIYELYLSVKSVLIRRGKQITEIHARDIHKIDGLHKYFSAAGLERCIYIDERGELQVVNPKKKIEPH